MENSVPRHIGLILDGNRRWAKQHDLPTLKGHEKGYERLREVLKSAYESGVEYVSAYVFSTENWQRSQEEVGYLMKLITRALNREVKELHRQGIRVLWFGSKENLPTKLINALYAAEDLTRSNTAGTFVLCFNYGGQQEITDAATRLIQDNQDITTDTLSSALYHPDVPPIDLVIRTSGEKRLSGFMLWRAAYSELYFTETLWPDFGADALQTALADYALRQRRFGS